MELRIVIIILSAIILLFCFAYQFSRKRIDSGAYLSGYPDIPEPIQHTELRINEGEVILYKKGSFSSFGSIPLSAIKDINTEKTTYDTSGVSTGILLPTTLITTAVTDSFLAGIGVGLFSNLFLKQKKEISLLIIEWNDGDINHLTGFAFSEREKAEKVKRYIERYL